MDFDAFGVYFHIFDPADSNFGHIRSKKLKGWPERAPLCVPVVQKKSNFEKHCYGSYSFDFRDTSRNFLQVKRVPKNMISPMGGDRGLETSPRALCPSLTFLVGIFSE